LSARFDLSLEAAADLREIADYIAEDDAARDVAALLSTT
jgi:plasmid stabilization system protein ParE